MATRELHDTSEAQIFIQELKNANQASRELAVDTIEKFSPNVNWQIAQRTERVGPWLVAKVFKEHPSWYAYFFAWLSSKNLLKSSIVNEVLLLSRSNDADIEDKKLAALQLKSYEIRSMKLYGFTKEFEDAKVESDWRRPSGNGAQAKAWKSKVK